MKLLAGLLLLAFAPVIGPARRAVFARPGDVDGELAALKFLVMELVNGALCPFGVGKFHKRKTA